MKRVPKGIWIGCVTALFGLIVGYVLKDWQDRAKPSIVVADVSFSTLSEEKIPPVEIPIDLQEWSRQSQWTGDLSPTLSYAELHELVTADLNETVDQLEFLSLYLPKLSQFVEEHKDKPDALKDYRDFNNREANPTGLTYFTLNMRGAIRRGELELRQLSEKYGPPTRASLLDRAKEADWKLSVLEDEADQDKAALMAVSLIVEWYPDDLAEALGVVKEQVAPQVVVNRKLLEGLQKLYRVRHKLSTSDFVQVEALLGNSGRGDVTLDRYAALYISGIDKTYFMVTQGDTVRTVLAPGTTERLSFRSQTALTPEDEAKLRILYDTEILECTLTTRVLTRSMFVPEWIASRPVKFASANEEIQALFLSKARKR